MPPFARFTALVQSLPPTVPFVGPETQERARGAAFRARLGANESGFGPSPKVIDAIAAAAHLSWRYADPENFDLREALAKTLGLTRQSIVVGEGIDGLLGLIVRLITEQGTPVVTSLGAYPTFNYHVAGFGGRLVAVPYRNDREDLQGLLDAVQRENAPLVYLSNPDNPMGSWHGADDIVTFAKALPETTLLILDEAYCETAPLDAVPAIAALAGQENVIRCRTFSKAYGLAGQRMGYAFGTPSTIAMFDRVRNHFGVNRLGQVAALAALADQAWLTKVVSEVAAARERIAAIATANDLKPLPSATNFVTIDCGQDAIFAKSILEACVARGLFIRMPGVAPLNRCIRISAGPADELAILEAELPGILAEIRG